MKKITITAAIFLSCIAYKSADAQVSLSINIGSQPAWGPVGYDRADYYYMPDIDTYYDVPAHRYVYLENNAWVRRASLPPRYSNYNLYNGYKVVVNEPRPWTRATVYRTKYANYKGRTGQTIIRDSRDVKYRNYWMGNNSRRPVRVVENKKVVKYKNNDRHDNGRHEGGDDRHHDKGKGHGRGH
ncbi:hypothetical protein [Mucilaginibacter phyllosphaerae]|uniref:DUF3300 domain-containing protein n=1 Tax=Mucilaginibacter phyllosphaerae TaxID=1812349 RepID=A0A4Y8AEB6_9SPHI|nr:hypothetical protein [Mucilaginibacter phyllosphaerae]MBB3970416.1 hypothetical protein [Mucilaginibacter phyllosphaerae]TEW66920.1 hypothetical protein E2R65_10955 [Mucilaginibacter phyllosphaerae]GGH12789.1 hypothetical protein GCM10007352_19790 [Mucilaginibacter phyllosphaerae]